MTEKLYSKVLVSAPFLEAAVSHFVDSLPNRIDEFQKALEAQDLEALKKAAHRLKGAAGTHGYPALSEHAKALEAAVQDEASSEMAALVETISSYQGRLVPAPPP